MLSNMKLVICLVCIFCGVQCQDLRLDFEKVLTDTDTTERKLTPILNFTTKCFPQYGCYYNGPPFFDPVRRPISPLPADNPEENIHYLLYTPQNLHDAYTLLLTKESLSNSPFNSSAKSAMYIHGWQQHIFSDSPMYVMRDSFVSERGYNFFILDWRSYVGDSYEEAIANGRVVGTAGSLLIKFLANNTGTKAEDFYLIGHSLGGQIVAYTGQETPGLGRITALDAAGPYFYSDSLEVRLDASDALFVDAIHTNNGNDFFDGLGMDIPFGHQNFYPNGGQRQPGCGHEDPITRKLMETNPVLLYLANCCNHARSQDYFLESLKNKNCTFKGTMCDSYDDWMAGKCQPSDNPVAVMGIDAAPIPGLPPHTSFYLDTRSEAPYCKTDGYIEPNMELAQF